MRLLWIKTSPLHPLTRGGDLRTYSLLVWLSKWHHITFAGMVADACQMSGAERAGEYSSSSVWTKEPKASLELSQSRFLFGALKNLVSRLPYAAERFESKRWSEQIGCVLNEGKFDLVVCDFLFPALSLPWGEKGRTPWIIFQHNVESMIWLRRAEKRGGLTRAYWKEQCRRMRRHEAEMCARFDGVITVSEKDASIFREQFGMTNVLGSTPTGVDLEYFQSVRRILPASPTVVFVGSMDWYANVDGVLFFVNEVWPIVRESIAEAVFQIVGRKPPPEVLSLASCSRGVQVTGTVPDVRPFMRQAHIMVVPLRIGGGTRLKVYEAMAAELPIVSTTIGAEGLPVEHERHLLIADDAPAMASAIVRLISNPGMADRIRTYALNEVARAFSWESAARDFESLCLELLRGRGE